MPEEMQIPAILQADNTQLHGVKKTAPEDKVQQENEFGFDDVLDIINPLHHIPVVSSVYKNNTDDEISSDSKVAGDVLYGVLSGGLLGVLGAIGNAIVQQRTGKDVGEHILAFANLEEVKSANLSDNIAQQSAKSQSLEQNLQQQNSQLKIAENKSEIVAKAQQSVKSQQPLENQQAEETQQLAQQNNYWSVRMKQLFDDDYFA